MTTESNKPSKRISKLKGSLFVKIFILLAVLVFLMIPQTWLGSLIRERQSMQRDAQYEVAQKWGKSQTILGPYLVIPYTEKKVDKYEDVEVVKEIEHIITLMPENIQYHANVEDEIRKRGIYEVILYNADIDIQGSIDLSHLQEYREDKVTIHWDEAQLQMNISDVVGIKEDIDLLWNASDTLRAQAGVANSRNGSGVHFKLPTLDGESIVDFSTRVSIKGSQSIFFSPTGKSTEVRMSSDWPHPKFTGNKLPDSHDITDAGFSAQWSLLSLHRKFPQHWKDDDFGFGNVPVGVELIRPVDQYLKNHRAVRYSFLVVAFAFLIYFIFEMGKRIRLHPMTYILVGLNLSLFFLILLALSEHIGFNKAYGISAAMHLGVLGVYSAALLKDKRSLVTLIGLMAFILAYIYVLLQMEDYALLAGSLGLFVLLSFLMIRSRKVDWYSLSNGEAVQEQEES